MKTLAILIAALSLSGIAITSASASSNNWTAAVVNAEHYKVGPAYARIFRKTLAKSEEYAPTCSWSTRQHLSYMCVTGSIKPYSTWWVMHPKTCVYRVIVVIGNRISQNRAVNICG